MIFVIFEKFTILYSVTVNDLYSTFDVLMKKHAEKLKFGRKISVFMWFI